MRPPSDSTSGTGAPGRVPAGAAASAPRYEIAPRTMMTVLLVVALGWLLFHMLPVLLVLVGGLMIVGALNPVIAWLETKKMPRTAAIGLVFGLAIGLGALGCFLTVPALFTQLGALADHEPEIREKIATYLDTSPLTGALANDLRHVQYTELLKNSGASLLTASVRALTLLAYVAGAVFLALYIMIDRDRLRGALFAVVPRGHHVRTSRILLNLETIVGGYIRGQAITCVMSTLFILGVLLACHVPDALALAVFGGLMDLLPYIGPLLTIAPAVGTAYLVGPGIAMTVFVLLVAYEEFESRVVIPYVYGRALRLPSSVVFFALLSGGILGGVLGALLALPIASAALMLIEELRVDLPGEAVLPEDVAQRRQDEHDEREYVERTEDAPAVEAAVVAVEIARERKRAEEEAAAPPK